MTLVHVDRLKMGAKNMLRKRGISDFEEFEIKNGYAFTASQTSRTSKILVYIPDIVDGYITKVKNDTLHNLYFVMESESINHSILIYNEITPPAVDMIRTHSVFRIELFGYKKMLFDPTIHMKTPLQEKMTLEEVSYELKGIKPEHLPSMIDDDVIARFYDWKVGDFIRIHRTDGLYYRLIVAS